MVITTLQQPARLISRRFPISALLTRHAPHRASAAVASMHSSVLSSSAMEHSMRDEIYDDTLVAKEAFFRHFDGDDHFRHQAVYSMSFSADAFENDLASDNDCLLIDDRMKRQIRNSYSTLKVPSNYTAREMRSRLPPELQLEHLESIAANEGETPLPPLEGDATEFRSTHHLPLPESINDINPSKLDKDIRAIVVTDTQNPFRITNVNAAWESLCGYTRDECQGRSLGSLLQGKETDVGAVTALVSKLLSGEKAGTILTNYTKSGRKFRNDLRVGPVVDEMGKTVRFVGVLREIKSDQPMEDRRGGGFGYKPKRDIVQLPFMS